MIAAPEMPDELRSFAELVKAMREAQHRYFTMGRQPGDLTEAKAIEREVDRRYKEILSPPGLFDKATDPIQEAIRETEHRVRNELSPAWSLVEVVKTHVRYGNINLEACPGLDRTLENCKR